MKRNFKISQFSRFLLKSEYAIQVKIWKWLKLLNFFQFMKKTLVNHLYISIWSFWLTFTALQWMKTNFKIIQLEDYCLSLGMRFFKIWKWLKLLNSVPFMKKTLANDVYIRIWSSWLTFTVLHWMKTNYKNWSIFKNSAKVRVCNSGQNLKMTETSYFCSIHEENTCKSSLHSNLIILTDFYSFTVNEEKLQN